jgi:hypothetical protein
MRANNNLNILDLENTLNLITNILSLLEYSIVQQSYVDPLIINARYYVVVHNVFLPIMIKEFESSIPKVYLTPTSSVYIHDQKIYAIFRTRYSIDYLNTSLDRIKIPIVDLTLDEKLLILASVSIAHRILLMPSEQGMLRIIPNNIKTYIEAALDILEKMELQKNFKKDLEGSRYINIIELVLWINNTIENDLIEVSYVKGLITEMFRILYRDYEIDLKSINKPTQRFLMKILSLLPTNVLIELVNNVKNVYRILQVFKVIYS